MNHMNGDDIRIIHDITDEEGVRHISVEPSALVCSNRIDFDLDPAGAIHNLRYTRGCNGNLQAIGRLLEGMPARQAADTLEGVNCNGRGTSCTDQLARTLRRLLK